MFNRGHGQVAEPIAVLSESALHKAACVEAHIGRRRDDPEKQPRHKVCVFGQYAFGMLSVKTAYEAYVFAGFSEFGIGAIGDVAAQQMHRALEISGEHGVFQFGIALCEVIVPFDICQRAVDALFYGLLQQLIL